jgi:diadenosine tetraphosphate (Ap4A) HIT family hydrolase
MNDTSACELCTQDGGEVVFRNTSLRVVIVDDADYPGFCRVIWNAHCKEMTDLSVEQRAELMSAVFVVESAVRKVMQPLKINLASLGNMTPHLHWHVIPRYSDDRHFPSPIWAAAQRTGQAQAARFSDNWRTQLGAFISASLSS